MRNFIFVTIVVLMAISTAVLLNRASRSTREAVSVPIKTLLGTGQEMNARLLEVSESPDTIRAVGRALLQPFGNVRMIRRYEPTDNDPAQTPTSLP